ncbi:Ubiquitin-60S ribosomal protein L40 [Paramecium bursaria]
MYLFIKTLQGLTFSFELEPNDTIQDVKEIIFQKQGFPPVMQRIIFGGKELLNHSTILDCLIQKDSTLHLILKQQ